MAILHPGSLQLEQPLETRGAGSDSPERVERGTESMFMIMDNWLKTGRLASGKSVVSCSPAVSTENISEEAVAGFSDTIRVATLRSDVNPLHIPKGGKQINKSLQYPGIMFLLRSLPGVVGCSRPDGTGVAGNTLQHPSTRNDPNPLHPKPSKLSPYCRFRSGSWDIDIIMNFSECGKPSSKHLALISNIDFTIIGILVYCESSVLEHEVIEAISDTQVNNKQTYPIARTLNDVGPKTNSINPPLQTRPNSTTDNKILRPR
uniref:Uncharacterized protein n=1 Tax=Timema monikensis TaxID=170555 RepID=A0A7R9E5H3_9NEOP|nr:unnamed protein product [Timema monikensis]